MYNVYVGGTFNILHDGHRKLLDMAVSYTEKGFRELIIGITTDSYAQSAREIKVRPYERRARDAKAYAESLKDHEGNSRLGYSEAHTVPIDNPNLPEGIDDTDVIVCSNETLPRVVQQLKGVPLDKRPLIRTIPLEPKGAGKSEKMSSTDIIQFIMGKSEFDTKLAHIEEYDGDMVGLMYGAYGVRDGLRLSPTDFKQVMAEEVRWGVR